ncbi:MAG: hypothetical protein R2711_08615 [Acidimicrobiales bacterium]
MSAVVPVRLIKGSDDVLRGEAFSKVLDEAVGDADRTLVVDEIDLDRTTLGAAIDAAQTPPFLTDFRVVVVRRFGRYSSRTRWRRSWPTSGPAPHHGADPGVGEDQPDRRGRGPSRSPRRRRSRRRSPRRSPAAAAW